VLREDGVAKDWAIELIDRALNERNFAYLADLIRKSDPSPKVRDHLATVVLGLLTGKIKLPAHRPKRAETAEEAKQIPKMVLQVHKWHRGWEKLSAAVKQVAQRKGCSESKVWNALRNHRLLAELHLDKVEYDTMVDAAYTANREAVIESLKQEYGDREFSDEEVEAAVEELEKAWANFDP
jgi:hypothetical protein